jgi:hypothetical protein
MHAMAKRSEDWSTGEGMPRAPEDPDLRHLPPDVRLLEKDSTAGSRPKAG